MRSTTASSQKAWIATAVLAPVFAGPVAVGFAFLIGPPSSSARPEWAPVARLETMPADRLPQKVPIVVPQFDAWSRMPDEVSGYIFLRRLEGRPQVLALRATTHEGCPVEFNAESRAFEDLCWNGLWDINGHRLHSIPEWGDLQPVRTAIRGDVVSINLNDAIP
jgi:hypothetical protein